MCSKYIAERHIIALMANELRQEPILSLRGRANLRLITAGFNRRDVETFIDRAIESERMRRLAIGVISQSIIRVG